MTSSSYTSAAYITAHVLSGILGDALLQFANVELYSLFIISGVSVLSSAIIGIMFLPFPIRSDDADPRPSEQVQELESDFDSVASSAMMDAENSLNSQFGVESSLVGQGVNLATAETAEETHESSFDFTKYGYCLISIRRQSF